LDSARSTAARAHDAGVGAILGVGAISPNFAAQPRQDQVTGFVLRTCIFVFFSRSRNTSPPCSRC